MLLQGHYWWEHHPGRVASSRNHASSRANSFTAISGHAAEQLKQVFGARNAPTGTVASAPH